MKQVINDILIILRHNEKRKWWLLLAADVCMSILDIAFLMALLFVTSFYAQPAQHFAGSRFSNEIFTSYPILLMAVFFVLFTLKNWAAFMVSAMQYRFVYNIAARISRENLQQYLEGNFLDFVHTDSSVVNRRINQQPIEFCHYVLNGVQQMIGQAVLVFITIVAVLIFNPMLFPLLLLILVPPVILVGWVIKKKLNAGRVHGKKTSEKAIQHLQEALYGFVESNIYRKNEYFISRYHRMQTRLNHYLSQRLILQTMPSRLMEVFAVFGLLVLVIVNAFTAHGNAISLVTIGALMVAAYKIIPGIVKITNTVGQVKTYAFAGADIAATAQLPLHAPQYENRVASIAFENVCFNYPGRHVFHSVSFAMKKGDFAIVPGLSGKGKTTLINLLLGFLCQETGEIFINGAPADKKKRQSCWAGIAYAKQQSFFLHASIIENISLQETSHDEYKMQEVLAISGLDKLVHTFPHGLETVIAENGRNFSGGQRQRIIFARALYKDFDLLILDEPFSELDEPSEFQLLQELRKMADRGKMILLITHNANALFFGNKKILLNEQE